MLLNRVAELASSVRIEGPGFLGLRQPAPGDYGLGRTARQSAAPAERADRLEISPGARTLHRLLRTAFGLKQPERPGFDLATLASTAMTKRYERQGRAALPQIRITPPAVTPVAPASGDKGVEPDLVPVATAIAAYDRQR